MRPVAVVCAGLLGVSQFSGGRVEGQDKAKTVTVWAQQLHHKDVAKRTEAAKAPEALGPQAKAAVPDLKSALKERAWELLLVFAQGKEANPNFTPPNPTIGGGPPRQPTKDEIIAELRRELAQSKR